MPPNPIGGFSRALRSPLTGSYGEMTGAAIAAKTRIASIAAGMQGHWRNLVYALERAEGWSICNNSCCCSYCMRGSYSYLMRGSMRA